ncbi:MerR family transcriptional regulator [Arthrobacter sp. C152]
MSAVVSRTQFPKEVATALGISVDSVARYAKEGLIPFEVTPKGHRRYNVEEVREALASALSPQPLRLGASPEFKGGKLIAGPEVQVSPQSLLQEDLRATRTLESAESPADDITDGRSSNSVFDEVLGHSRRVLVAASR